MSETRSGPFSFFGSDLVLGIMIGLLSIGTAGASYLSAMADSDQTKYNLKGMQFLTDANSEYLTANQDIIQDYTNFDSYYLNSEDAEKSEYYQGNFSEALQANMERPGDAVFDEQYYDDMYAGPNALFDEADTWFVIGEAFNTRGDQFQLVVLVGAIGLAFAAWASLLAEGKKMRVLFGVLAVITFLLALYVFLFQIPPAPVLPPGA